MISFTVDGETFTGNEGDTIASALYANGKRSWRLGKAGDYRGLFCGIGICYDCLVKVDGMSWSRACQVEIHPGMCVETNLQGEGHL